MRKFNSHCPEDPDESAPKCCISSGFALFVNVKIICRDIKCTLISLPAHPASFKHNFVSGMQSFYFSKSQDAIVLQTCH